MDKEKNHSNTKLNARRNEPETAIITRKTPHRTAEGQRHDTGKRGRLEKTEWETYTSDILRKKPRMPRGERRDQEYEALWGI